MRGLNLKDIDLRTVYPLNEVIKMTGYSRSTITRARDGQDRVLLRQHNGHRNRFLGEDIIKWFNGRFDV